MSIFSFSGGVFLQASTGERRNMEQVKARQSAGLLIPDLKSHISCVNLIPRGRGGDEEASKPRMTKILCVFI